MSGRFCCNVCREPSQHRCGNCRLVAYCSKQHQKQDWKAHRLKCATFKIADNAELGRHLVAARDISPGEIILREIPLVSGPLQNTPPVCLACYRLVNEFNSRECSLCGWPVCSIECEQSKVHQPECEITCEFKKSKVKIQTFMVPHPSYQCLTVLRCLYLKRKSPKVWEKLCKLQSHSEERDTNVNYRRDRCSIAQFILRFFKIPDFTEEEIFTMAGVVQVNAHEVPLADPGYVSIYDTASFLEHSCHANCSKSFTNEGEVVIRAAMPISANDHLSICYTDPLWGTAGRRSHLAETKFFDCVCSRCVDATELGTHFSSVKCNSRECDGFIVSNSPLLNLKNPEKEIGWSCQSCGKTISCYDAMSMLEKIGEDAVKLDKTNYSACKAFIRQYSNLLHPNHYLLTDVKLSLIQVCGQNDGLLTTSEQDLDLKMDYCRQLYDLASKLVPAENRLRGFLLFELHSALAETGRRKSNRGELDAEGLRFNLMECKKVLKEAYRLLSFEPDMLPEGKMAIQAAKNLQDIEKLLGNISAPVML